MIFQVLITLLIFGGNALAKEVPDQIEDLRVSFSSLPEKVDNLVWQSLDRWYIISNVYDQLVYFDRQHNMYSDLLKKWTVSSDRKRIELILKDEIFFSNGRPIQATDVQFSLKRCLIRQPVDSPLRRAFVDGEKFNSMSSKHPGIEVDGKATIRLKLSTPFASLWTWLSLPMCGGVIAPETVDSRTLEILRNDAVSGPYMVKEIRKDKIVLTQNPYRKSSTTAPKTIGYYLHTDGRDASQKFASGATNLFIVLEPFQSTEVTKLLKDEDLSFPLHRVGFLYLNPKKWRDKTDRHRFAGLFDRRSFSDVKNQLLVWSNSFFPVGVPGNLNQPFTQVDGNLKTKEIRILLDENLPSEQIRSFLNPRLASRSLETQYVFKSKFAIYQALSSGEFDVAFLSIGFPAMDQSLGIYLYFLSKPPYLLDESGAINSLYTKYLREVDESRRVDLMRDVALEIRDQSYIVPLYNTGIRYLLGKGVRATDRVPLKSDLTFIDLEVTK